MYGTYLLEWWGGKIIVIVKEDKMVRYFVTLFVSAVFIAMAFFAWTPAAKSGVPTPIPLDPCQSFCEESYICACATKLFSFLRLTDCEFTTSCLDTVCQCGEVTADCKEGKKKSEIPLVWLASPQPTPPPCPE
jgi:hypothetical protein